MFYCSRIQTHQFGNMGELLVILLDTFHLEFDFKVHNSLMKVFRQATGYILLCTFSIGSLNLLLSFQAQLLLLIVMLLGFLLLHVVGCSRREVLLSVLLVIRVVLWDLRDVEPDWLLWRCIWPTLFLLIARKCETTLLAWTYIRLSLLILLKPRLPTATIFLHRSLSCFNRFINRIVSTLTSIPSPCGDGQFLAEPVSDSKIFHHHC